MKTKIFFKLALILISLGLVTQILHAQDFKLRYDSSFIEGCWIATEGEFTYELTIQKNAIYNSDIKQNVEILLGALIYKKNETIIRQTEIKQYKSIINGILDSSHNGKLRFCDTERKIEGDILFIVNSDNPKKATWKLTRRVSPTLRWTETEFDIPTELEWTKIE